LGFLHTIYIAGFANIGKMFMRTLAKAKITYSLFELLEILKNNNNSN